MLENMDHQVSDTFGEERNQKKGTVAPGVHSTHTGTEFVHHS